MKEVKFRAATVGTQTGGTRLENREPTMEDEAISRNQGYFPEVV